MLNNLLKRLKRPKHRPSPFAIGLICLGALFLILAFFFNQIFSTRQPANILDSDTLLSFEVDTIATTSVKITTTSFRIIIPAIGVDMNVVENEKNEKKALDKGAWLIPGSEVPGTNMGYNNTVIAAHRYQYKSGPRTFYFLNKVMIGDTVVLERDGITYRYVVYETKIVPNTAVEILDKTSEPILTLFTCHPLYSSKERLVVLAKPVL